MGLTQLSGNPGESDDERATIRTTRKAKMEASRDGHITRPGTGHLITRKMWAEKVTSPNSHLVKHILSRRLTM